MNKTVKKIVVNTEGIDVISELNEENTVGINVIAELNEVNNVNQLDLEPQDNEIEDIFKEFNLEKSVIYHYDEKIIRALADNKEQLVDYLEVCRKAYYPAKKVEIPNTIPNIEYDLRDLKSAFSNIKDDELRKIKQIDLYKKAKEVQNMLRGKVLLKMKILDRAYFSVQEMLQNRTDKPTRPLLSPGIIEEKINLKDRLYNPEFTKKANEVLKNDSIQKIDDNQQKKDTELVR